jgi:hypothetical protein
MRGFFDLLNVFHLAFYKEYNTRFNFVQALDKIEGLLRLGTVFTTPFLKMSSKSVPTSASKPFVMNFKVGKYLLQGEGYFQFMRKLARVLDSETQKNDLYIVFLFDTGKEYVKSHKNKTSVEVEAILDDLKQSLLTMPQDLKEEIVRDFIENY